MLVIVRINYGQNLDINCLVGAVSLCGLGDGIWLVEGGNWKMDASLNDWQNRSFFTSPQSIFFNFIKGNKYEVNSTYKQVHYYEVVVLDIRMDEIKSSMNLYHHINSITTSSARLYKIFQGCLKYDILWVVIYFQPL